MAAGMNGKPWIATIPQLEFRIVHRHCMTDWSGPACRQNSTAKG
jgi:hypothetical protein